jgi:carboxyl-terminal processing protease
VDEAIYKRGGLGTVRGMLKRIVSIGLGVIAGYLMTLGVVQVVSAWRLWPDRETRLATEQVTDVLRLMNRHYVEGEAVGVNTLATRAIESMVGALDPYSEFLPPQAYKHLNEEVDGAFGGIGVQVEEVGGDILVIAPIAGTPGERAGILRGDVFVRVDDESVAGLKLEEFVSRLRGKPGTQVTVTLRRGEPARELELRLKREVIKVESVRDAKLLEDGVGYVRVGVFAEKTGEEFKSAVEKLSAQGARALVIDLRNNPGGLLTSAAELVEPFFPRGELIVYTQGRRPEDRQELRSEGSREPLRLPLAVLINGGSASASEIVAGALQDTGRAVLVGEKSFGKGSVQSIYPLSGDAALRLTTARYYTPSGVVIHERGIQPDIREVLTPEEEKAIFLGRLRPDVTDPALFAEKFGVPPAEDTQLAAALRELRAQLGGAEPTRRRATPSESEVSAELSAEAAALDGLTVVEPLPSVAPAQPTAPAEPAEVSP